MTLSHPETPKQTCERLLIEEKRYNAEHQILPSESAIVDRLLARNLELCEAYEELHGRLSHHPNALKTFLGIVLTTAALWNPEKISEARSARDALTKINQQIARKAMELADLLDHRSHLGNTSNFRTETHYHVCEVITAAAQGNSSFRHYVQERLGAIRRQFDLKYWPKLDDFVREIGRDAGASVPEASDPLTAAATKALRPSLADFVKALFASIEENNASSYGFLPNDLQISDAALAALVNCSLDLEPERTVDGAYVKRFRQRERELAG